MEYWSRYKNNAALRCLAIDLPIPVALAWRKDSTKRALPQFARETAAFFARQEI